MSPYHGSSSCYPRKGNGYLCIFPLYFILYPLQLYQTACHWVTNSYKRCKKPIQEGSPFQFETSKPEHNFMRKANVIEQVLELLNAIRKGGNEDDVRSVLGIVSTFLEWHFPKNSQSTVGNIAKFDAKHQCDRQNNETFANSSKHHEIISDYEKELGNGKNTVLLEESVKITEREPKKTANSNYSTSFIDYEVENKIAEPAELPDFLGFSGEGKNTNVQKNGMQVESTEKGENSSLAGNVAPSFTCNKNGGIGSGGSDGDGNDEPHNRDNSLPNGHYEESPVVQQRKQVGICSNHHPLSPVENDTNLPDNTLLSTHGSGLNNVNAIRSNHSERRKQTEESTSCIIVDDEESIDVYSKQPKNVDVAYDGNFTIPNMSTMPQPVLGSPNDLDSSSQLASSISTNLASENQAQTFEESLPFQKILSPLNKDMLAVEKDGTYREHHNFISLGFAGAGRFGRCDFCQDKKTATDFVRKKMMRRSEFDENEIILWRQLDAGLNRNILTFFGALEENQYIFLFMECMSGSLADIANMRISLSEKEVLVIFKQVLEGLCFIHEKEIIHRDIKCENLFYNYYTFDIKIGDFGLSCHLNEELVVKNEQLCGTVQGMAYERCKGWPYGRSSDMWSFACAVIHLITGHMAWPDCETHLQIIYQVGSGSIPKLPSEAECSREFNQMLLNLFSKDSAQRATAKQLLCHSIFTSMSESQFEEELAGVFGRILEYQHSSSQEESNGSDLAASTREVIGYSPMSLSGPDHGISYDEPQDDFANLDYQEVYEGNNDFECNVEKTCTSCMNVTEKD